MISIIYSNSTVHNQLKKVEKFFNKKRINYELIQNNHLKIKDLKKLFALSTDISQILNRNYIKDFNWDIKFNELLNLIKNNSKILKTLIIVDYEKKLLEFGSMEDTLEMFIRKVQQENE